jgi:metal-responsive CopG/Arc/MetJ family transcriptional regulator
MADKTVSISITMPESLYNELNALACDLDVSRSHVIGHSLLIQMPVLKKHPMLIKFAEFEAVTQHFNDNSKPA